MLFSLRTGNEQVFSFNCHWCTHTIDIGGGLEFTANEISTQCQKKKKATRSVKMGRPPREARWLVWLHTHLSSIQGFRPSTLQSHINSINGMPQKKHHDTARILTGDAYCKKRFCCKRRHCPSILLYIKETKSFWRSQKSVFISQPVLIRSLIMANLMTYSLIYTVRLMACQVLSPFFTRL